MGNISILGYGAGVPKAKGYTGMWPPVDPFPLPEPPECAGIDKDILTILKASYVDHDPNNKYLDNCFWGANPYDAATWPQTLWEALKKARMPVVQKAVINTLTHARKYPFLFSQVKRIKNFWETATDAGFNMDTLGQDMVLAKDLDASLSFGRDTPFTEHFEHHGQDCWREMGCFGNPGLHVCLFNNRAAEIHLDFHQPTASKNYLGMKKPFGYAPYYFPALLDHWSDMINEKYGQ
jgi:hypothetical protein